MKRANGSGTIAKLAGNRRRPWTIRRVIGWKESGAPIIKYQGYYRTRREAEKALNEYNADPYTISQKTLNDIYKEWYAQREKDKSENTLRGYRTNYTHLEPLYETKIKDIDRNTLQLYVDNIEDITDITLYKTLKLLNQILEYAVKRNYLPISALYITKAIDVPRKTPSAKYGRERISEEDINRLWTMKDKDFVKIILFYIYTGLRFNELKGLTPDCWHQDHIEIRKAKTAAGVRIVPICEKMQALLPLIEIPAYHEYIKHFTLLLPGHTPHDTRHTFISMLTEAHADARIIKAIVGHKSNDVTDIYTHISLEAMLEAVNML